MEEIFAPPTFWRSFLQEGSVSPWLLLFLLVGLAVSLVITRPPVLSVTQSKAGLVRAVTLFGLGGFLFGLTAASVVIQSWSAAMGKNFASFSSTEIVLAHLRFAAGCAVLAAGAPCTAAIFPGRTATRRPAWIYLAFSLTLGALLLGFVRASIFDLRHVLVIPPRPRSVAALPFFLCPAASAILTLGLAAALRFADTRGIFRQLSQQKAPARFDF